ncbi:MAG: hypothetical protein M3R08_08750, partial [Bacteroidota bacterium]|nr:hypothetical protein [Bacteroidota bacterium]
CGRSRLSAIADHWGRVPPDLLLMPVDTIGAAGIHSGMQRMEQLALQSVTAGSASIGIPILANGANLAFSRGTFFQLGGFNNDRWASGDDMFLLQRMRRARKRIDLLLDPDVVVTVRAEATLKEAFQQRLRWAGKMRAYREGRVMLAMIAGLFLPWILMIATVISLDHVKAGEGLINTLLLLMSAWLLWSVPIIRLVASMDTFFAHAAQRNGRGSQRPKIRSLWLSTIPALIAFMIYAPIIAILSIFVRPIWKGRRI